jgi:hypothetical protein
MLIRRDMDRNGRLSRHFEQDFGCLALERVNASQCCGLPLECEVSRTKRPIPRTVRLKDDTYGLTAVNDPSGLIPIPLVDTPTVYLLPHDRFTKNTRKGYMIEDYLYIYNPDGMDTVNVRGIAENPEDLASYECGDGQCFDDDSQYPLPMDLVSAITDGLVKGTFTMIAQTGSDTANDAVQDQHMGQNEKGKKAS